MNEIVISWQVAAVLLVAFLTMVFAFGRILLAQFERRMDERRETNAKAIKALESKIDAEGEQMRSLERRIAEHVARLPLEYVRREDWIRMSATIDAKLDRLAELFLQIKHKG